MAHKPRPRLPYAILAGVQLCFGIGGILGKLGFPHSNPVVFALIREGFAGPILLLIAYYRGYLRNVSSLNLWHFLLPGLCMFGNQLFFVVGLKIGNEVSAAVWQQGQPIYTFVIATMLGWERPTPLKIFGILIACSGSVFIVMHGSATASDPDQRATHVLSSVLFILNGICQSIFVVVCKFLIGKHGHHPTTVTGMSYVVAAVFMTIAAVIVNNTKSVFQIVAPDCSFNSPWRVLPQAMPALIYWIIFSSVIAYTGMTWASQYLQASIVSAFVVCQPFITVTVSFILVATHNNPNGTLHPESTSNLGGLGVMLGLLMLIADERNNHHHHQQPHDWLSKSTSSTTVVSRTGFTHTLSQDDDDSELKSFVSHTNLQKYDTEDINMVYVSPATPPSTPPTTIHTKPDTNAVHTTKLLLRMIVANKREERTSDANDDDENAPMVLQHS
eukprot:c15161_g1_i1.p1 GENE.c15161_g1_i1~~c15161_g1_i1.p1  ORF type:complete len:454 (+),score=86.13 c15161_g1_i1:33-1364(+)